MTRLTRRNGRAGIGCCLAPGRSRARLRAGMTPSELNIKKKRGFTPPLAEMAPSMSSLSSDSCVGGWGEGEVDWIQQGS